MYLTGGLTASKAIGYSIFLFANLLIFFFLFLHTPNGEKASPPIQSLVISDAQSPSENGIDNMVGQPLSLPLYEDPLIRGKTPEMLPFIKLVANNHDPHRMETQIPPEMLYQFDWTQEDRGSETIFVSMPSLNDPDCNDTIASAFGESSNPDRLYFGVYEQNSENSGLDCLDFSGVDCPYHPICSRRDHIRITRVDAREARGPTWGRYNADKLWGGQQFVFVTGL